MRIGAAVSLAASLGFLGVLGTSSPAAAEDGFDGTRPKGSYVQIPPAEPGTAELHSSSIISGTVTVREFNAGNSAWNAVVACVKAMYEPFGVEITDQDPGSTVSHFEAIVAGYPQDIGAGSGVGGVSPFSCGIINNAITYSFANIYGGSVQDICEVVAQETAHAFGLDHEYYCPDPMTYLYGCGAKQFRDYNAPCGEGSARQCACGGSTQNSYQKILSIFGPGTPTPPTV
ncbi:MAG TPA: hypothetical protein VML75_00480, partial [Kofleriaceae bacterium]|nr:hypothetical protein [Kofleriaceae bacterium]